MRRTASALGLAIALATGPAAVAQERPYTPALKGPAINTSGAREHKGGRASSEHAYELVHVNTMDCASDETGAPAFEPSSDEPNCLAGWRCKQRNSDGSTNR